ncbi:MAG: hypothetical protein HYS04_14940 [Acidobacteria bacterium]|nr:hypothetical protein [Acidobacteriota bacterium]
MPLVLSPVSSQKLALALSTLLVPASVAAYVLGCWRLGSDLNLTGEFAIRRGIFSHWQVWIALGAAMHILSFGLGRYARRSSFPGSDARPI